MAVVKCKYCGKQIEKDNAYKIADRQYYCNKTCYDDKQRSKIDNGKTNKIKYKPQRTLIFQPLSPILERLIPTL